MKRFVTFTFLCSFFGYSYALIKFEDVKEEGCVGNVESTVRSMSIEWILELSDGKKFFIPTGSKSIYYLWMELMAGQSIESESELMTQMCPSFTITLSSLNISSFGTNLIQKCKLESNGNVQCKSDSSPANRADSELIFHWTDNKENMLVIFCIDKKYKAWGLFSMVTKIKPEVEEIIPGKLKDFGLDSKKSLVYNYGECKL